MRKEIKEFVENYNKVMSWQKDIREAIGEDFLKGLSRTVSMEVNDYISAEPITEDRFDLETAELYETEKTDTNEAYTEICVHNRYECGTVTFFLHPDDLNDEMQYKRKRISKVIERLNRIDSKNREQIEYLLKENNEIEELETRLTDKFD